MAFLDLSSAAFNGVLRGVSVSAYSEMSPVDIHLVLVESLVEVGVHGLDLSFELSLRSSEGRVLGGQLVHLQRQLCESVDRVPDAISR